MVVRPGGCPCTTNWRVPLLRLFLVGPRVYIKTLGLFLGYVISDRGEGKKCSNIV